MVLLNVGPMGPRGLGPNPSSTVSQIPSGGFFSGKTASPKKIARNYQKNVGCFVILANVDLNLRLKICRIAI